MVFVLARSLIYVLRTGEFDALFTTSDMHIEERPAALFELRKGDWAYFKNLPMYDVLNRELARRGLYRGGFRGENVIKVGPGRYWGFPPGGSASYTSWLRDLMEAYNALVLRAYHAGIIHADASNYMVEDIRQVPGHAGWARFFDTAAIAQKVFEHRKPSLPAPLRRLQ